MATQERVDIVVNADTYAGKKMLEEMQRAFEKIGQAGNKSGSATGSAWAGAAKDIGKFALGMAGAQSITQALSTAIGRLRAEYENFIQRSDKAAQMQTNYADAERRMSQVLGDMDRATASKNVLAISRQFGSEPTAVANALASALSGKGETLPDSYAIEAVNEAARYSPGPRTQASELGGLAATILMQQKTNPALTAKEAMAFIANVQRSDRSESVESLSRYLLPSIITATGFGKSGAPGDMRLMSAIGTAIGSRAEDPTGEVSSTALQALARQVKLWTLPHVGQDADFAEQWKFLTTTDEGRKIRAQALGGLMRGDETVLGADVDLKAGRGRMLIPLAELLQDGDTATKRMMQASLQQIFEPGDPRSVAAYEKMMAGNAASPFQNTAQIQNAMAGVMPGLVLPDTRRGAIGQFNRDIPEVLQASGVSKLVQNLVLTKFQASSALAEDRTGVLKAGITALEAGLTPETGYAAGPAGGVSFPLKLTPQEKETNALIRELIDQLKSQMKAPQKITIEQGGEEHRGRIEVERAGR